MARKKASDDDRAHGRRLGRLIADRRERRRLSAPELARDSAVAVDTVRSLEGGRVPTPAFLTIARLAEVLGLSLDELHARASAGAATPDDAEGHSS
jgi:transcriptional regulator with XRE-family HTH domain